MNWGCDCDTKSDKRAAECRRKAPFTGSLAQGRLHTRQLLGAWDCATGLVAKGPLPSREGQGGPPQGGPTLQLQRAGGIYSGT